MYEGPPAGNERCFLFLLCKGCIMKKLKDFLFIAAMVTVLLTGCGKSGTTSSSGLTITGSVYDISTSPPTALSGVTVTLRRAADNSVLSTSMTGGDGSFALTDAPPSTDMYINVSAPGYVGFNAAIMNTATDVGGMLLWIARTANVQYTVDLITGNSGTTATWSDPFYTARSWFSMDIYNAAQSEVPGVNVTASPASNIFYNNGKNAFFLTGPTVVPMATVTAVMVGGYSTSSGIYDFTLTDTSKARYLKLPLIPGEMTYVSVYPW